MQNSTPRNVWQTIVFYSYMIPISGASMLFAVMLLTGTALQVFLSIIAVIASCEAFRRRLKRGFFLKNPKKPKLL